MIFPKVFCIFRNKGYASDTHPIRGSLFNRYAKDTHSIRSISLNLFSQILCMPEECSHPVPALHRILVCFSETADGPATWLATKTLATHARVSLRGSAKRLCLQNRCPPAQLQPASHPCVPTVYPQRRDPNAPTRALGQLHAAGTRGAPKRGTVVSGPQDAMRRNDTAIAAAPRRVRGCHTVAFEAAIDSRGRSRETRFAYVDGCVHESPDFRAAWGFVTGMLQGMLRGLCNKM